MSTCSAIKKNTNIKQNFLSEDRLRGFPTDYHYSSPTLILLLMIFQSHASLILNNLAPQMRALIPLHSSNPYMALYHREYMLLTCVSCVMSHVSNTWSHQTLSHWNTYYSQCPCHPVLSTQLVPLQKLSRLHNPLFQHGFSFVIRIHKAVSAGLMTSRRLRNASTNLIDHQVRLTIISLPQQTSNILYLFLMHLDQQSLLTSVFLEPPPLSLTPLSSSYILQ